LWMGWTRTIFNCLLICLLAIYLLPYTEKKHVNFKTEKAPFDGDTYFKNAQGLWLFSRQWKPVGTPKAAVYIVHGYAEYCGRHHMFATELARAGYIVFAFDLQGHGKSQGDRAYVENFQDYTADLIQLVQETSAELPADLPKFLFGHSMGGLISLWTVFEMPENAWNGLILSAPLIQSKIKGPFLEFIAKTLASLLPKLPVPGVGIPSTTLSRDDFIVHEQRNNPLVYHGNFKIGWGHEIAQALDKLAPLLSSLKLPFIVLHGTSDQLTESHGSQLLHSQAQSKDKTIKLYQNAYHELLLDINKQEVISDILSWLNAHTPNQSR